MNATPVVASATARRSGGFAGSRSGVLRQGVGFKGDSRTLKARASFPRRVAAPSGLKVVAEKVVGIDLGTTNSAVSSPSPPGSSSLFKFSGNTHACAIFSKL